MGETPKLARGSAAPLKRSTVRTTMPLPETPITLHQAQWDSDELGTDETTLQDAIETLCYDYLEQEHGGWMDNDGAFGEFEFDVAARTIHLEFNGRFTDVCTETLRILREATMAHPYHHALSSVKKWGGTVQDYHRIHDWFDASKQITADFRHRALRHHAEGIFMAETIFGKTITLSTGRVILVRWIGQQHVREDLGFIPSFADWVKAIRPEPWMGRAQKPKPRRYPIPLRSSPPPRRLYPVRFAPGGPGFFLRP